MSVVVWTPNSARIWWACPTCKVEGGVTPPVPVSEMTARLKEFNSKHSECATNNAPAWRK